MGTKTKSNDIVKPAKATKPRSELQQVQAQANWAVHFKLQPFHSCYTNKIGLSSITKHYIDTYNETVAALKELIAEDAAWTKHRVKERQDEEAAEAAKFLAMWNKGIDEIEPAF